MGRIILDNERCKGCFLCVDVCPKKLLNKNAEFNSKGNCTVYFEDSANECSGCALCARRCPDLAIVEVYR